MHIYRDIEPKVIFLLHFAECNISSVDHRSFLTFNFYLTEGHGVISFTVLLSKASLLKLSLLID